MSHNNFNFNAAEVDEILVRMKVSQAGNTKLYFVTQATGTYSGSRQVATNTPSAGEWGLVRFPVSNNEEWSGTITRLRFHPVNIDGTDFEVDWILATDGDLDDDGVPDEVEFNLGRNLLAPVESGLDADGDGDSDLWEMITGFSPDDAASRFTSSFQVELDGDRKMMFPAKPGRRYTLHRSFDLNDWSAIDTMLSGSTDGPMEFEDSRAVPDGRSFYKIGVEIVD